MQVVFARGGGAKTYAVIPYRCEGTPSELDVIDSDTQDELHLTRLRENCYTPIALDEAGDALHRGIRWRECGDSPRWRWAMLGREIYVLAPGDTFGLHGYVSVECLWLNERQAVLATAGLRDEVTAALHKAGCTAFEVLDREDSGVPAGWILFRDVTPIRAVPRCEGATNLNALCPLPDVKPEFVGGIRLGRRTWLAGFPPRIRVAGPLGPDERVMIDGQPVQPAGDGGLEALNWDATGEHRLWFGDRAVAYEIRTMQENWSHWSAHDFGTGAAICGAVVCRTDAARWHQVRVSASNPVLVGARPGDYFCCRVSRATRGDPIVAEVPFVPVWALPLDPLHADRRSVRVVLLNSIEPVDEKQALRRGNVGDALGPWMTAINDAGRKQLDLACESEDARRLWRRYRTVAKQLWRRLR